MIKEVLCCAYNNKDDSQHCIMYCGFYYEAPFIVTRGGDEMKVKKSDSYSK